MSPNETQTETEKQKQIIAEIRRKRKLRENTYRARALKLFPHVCGKCGREFAGKKLKELTVHHRDHDHDNNPPDGSNWELLCIYCHDNEHQRELEAQAEGPASTRPGDLATHAPFAGLKALLERGER